MQWLNRIIDALKGRVLAYVGIGALATILTLTAWAMIEHHGRLGWKHKYETLDHQAGVVLQATRQASGNPKLTWQNVPGQVLALGDEASTLRVELQDTNKTIDQMAAEAVKARARNAELTRLADKAEAQRDAALRKLSDLRNTPGTRSDCETLLREASAALNIIREASRNQAGSGPEKSP